MKRLLSALAFALLFAPKAYAIVDIVEVPMVEEPVVTPEVSAPAITEEESIATRSARSTTNITANTVILMNQQAARSANLATGAAAGCDQTQKGSKADQTACQTQSAKSSSRHAHLGLVVVGSTLLALFCIAVVFGS